MDVIEQVTAVAMVLLLLCGTLWWLRRRGFAVIGGPGRGNSRRMECVERLSLGPQHALHLIQLGNTELLISSSPGGCSLLHSRAQADREVAR